MTTTETARQGVDTTMMYVVHDAFQRDTDRMVVLAERGPSAAAAMRATWTRFAGYLHVHHTAEDSHLWPVLQGKLAGRPADIATLARMEGQHAALDAHLDAVARGLRAPSREPLPQLLRRLGAALTEHCEDEERTVLPLVRELVDEREWRAFGMQQRRLVGLRGAAAFFPWLLDDAPDDTQRTVLAMLPPPVRLLYRTVWRPRYRRAQRKNGLLAR